ncbi:hypothetical protein [Rubrivirga sp.]|uniref:hypothetical protein n=1 Tax=Rubrivirga sp. TaxID=1885344 RepID=UPI003B51D1F3
MLRSLFLLALVVAVLAGCDTSEPDGTAPAPISPAAFALDTDAFPDANSRVDAGPNYLNAAARVGIVSTVVGLNLVLPVAATDAVTRDAPTLDPDGDFVWRATVDVFGTPVALRLKGAVEDGDVNWRLVTAEDTDAPFTYYTATTSLDGETGSWRLFNPNESGAVLTATFDVRDLNDREVTFRVPDGRENGRSSVRYATDGTEQTFDWLSQPEGDRALIVWDRETRAGSITADAYNGGARACWDADLRDVAC